MMSRGKWMGTLVVLGALGVGTVGLLRSTSADAAPEAKSRPASSEVRVQLAQVRGVSATAREEVTGTLSPAKALQLGFEVGGRLQKVRVTRGQEVKEGEVLGQLDPEMANAQLAQAKAALAAAEAGAGLAADVAQRNLQLKAEGSVSEVQSLSTTTTSRQAEAQLLGARAAVAQAAAVRKRHDLRAPFGGTLIEAPDQVGATVAPGMALFKLEQLDSLTLRATLSETQRLQVRPGVKVRVEAVNGGVFTDEAVVRKVLPSADATTRRVPVEIEVPNADGRFLAHTLARAVLPMGEAQEGQVIPATALASSGGDHVYVVGRDGKAKRLSVTVLERGSREITVRAPEPLQQVIDFPSAGLTDGTRVSVK